MQDKSSKENHDLKINVLSSGYVPPKTKGYKTVWFNLYGIREADQDLVKYMGHISMDNKEAKKLLINANEKIKEQLKVFCEVHGAVFIK